jgi:hypothetical protein
MKSLKIWSLAMILLMALVGCSKKGNNPGTTDPVGSFEGIEKEWKLVSVDGVGADFNVYIKFEMGSFAMYQQIYTLEYKFFDGEYKVNGSTLSGSYFDGGEWKTSYTGGITNEGNTLTLKSKEENPITCVYEACTIPEQIKEEALNSTRSTEVVPFL